MEPVVLDIEGLTVSIERSEGAALPLVHDLSLSIRAGEIVALAGESGSGKSISGLALARLCPPGIRVSATRMRFLGENVLSMPPRRLRQLRGGGIAYIFQEPSDSLNPVRRIGTQIEEGLRLHGDRGDDRASALRSALADVGLAPGTARRYPHQLSGGMLQRAMIAMALTRRPRLLVADEPTTALDVTVQSQILRLLREVRDRTGMAILLITHNLGVVAEIADRLSMMYAGRLVETGPVTAVLRRPRHPYTRTLLAAVPRLSGHGQAAYVPGGRVSGAAPAGTGCAFQPRCEDAKQCCSQDIPVMDPVDQEYSVRCHCWKSRD